MERNYDEKRCYRVWIYKNGVMSEAFFTSKTDAEEYANYINTKCGDDVVVMNKWSWAMMIEK